MATTAQKQLLHRLQRQKSMSEDVYRNLILQYSNGRTDTYRYIKGTHQRGSPATDIETDGRRREKQMGGKEKAQTGMPDIPHIMRNQRT